MVTVVSADMILRERFFFLSWLEHYWAKEVATISSAFLICHVSSYL